MQNRKKTIFIVVAVVICLALSALAINIFRVKTFTDAFHSIDMQSVDRIRIVDQGIEVNSQNQSLIDQFTALVSQLRIKTIYPQPATVEGYQYYVAFYSDDAELFRIVTSRNDNLGINTRKYNVHNPEVVEQINTLIEQQYQ